MKRRSMLWLFCLLIAAHPSCRCCPNGSCKWAWEDCPSCHDPFACNSVGSANLGLVPEAPIPDLLDANVTEPRETSTDAMPFATPPVGGTLALMTTPSGTFAIASITERDHVHVVRIDATEERLALRNSEDVVLRRGDEPGRVVADTARGVAYVALRHGGAIVTIDPATAALVARWNVCSGPRGVAFDHTRDTIHVACASGDLVTLSAASGVETTRTFVARGLEEIAVQGDELVAGDGSRLFVVGADGSVRSGNSTLGFMGPLRTTDAWTSSVALATSNVATEFALVSPEGTIGPSMLVRDRPMHVSDMAVSTSGAIVIAAEYAAFLLGPGDSEFAKIPTASVASVATCTVPDEKSERFAVQTKDAILFFDLRGLNVATESLLR